MSKLDISKIRTEWDLSPLLKSDDDPQIKAYRAATTKAADAFVSKWRSRDDYLTDPKVLKEALDEAEAMDASNAYGADAYYFFMRSSLDSISPLLKAQSNKAAEFYQNLYNKMQFFWLSVGGIEPSRQKEFLASPHLADYRHLVERQFALASHRLSEPEEKIMVLKSTPAHGLWVRMTSDAFSKDQREVIDESGKAITVGLEEMSALVQSPKKKVRDTAAAAFQDMLREHLDMSVAEMNAILEDKKTTDQLRGYDRPDQSRHLGDDMETEVVDALVAAVTSRQDVSHRFYELRAKLLGQKKLAYHERAVEIGNVNQKYAFEDAVRLTTEVFGQLDPEFADIFVRFLENGQVDVAPRKGKVPGAFCASGELAHPTYILLNYTETLRDVTTLAHEMGHGINNELMRQKQNALNFGGPTSTAEVASTFMEDFVVDRLLEEADDESELVLRIGILDDAVASIFRQVAFYRFEQEMHKEFAKKGYLSGEDIGDLFVKQMAAYMGGVFGGSKDAANWWAYVSHFRRFFYVYSYASGLLISKALQGKVRQDKNVIQQVKTFLSSGSSASPKELFSDMGIDITDKGFWEKGLQEIDELLKDTEALAKKLGRI